jgi:hypothetical protein
MNQRKSVEPGGTGAEAVAPAAAGVELDGMDSSRDLNGIDVPKSPCVHSVEGGAEMNSTTIAVDVAKSVFEVAVSEQPGLVRERHRFSRARFRQLLAE